MPDTARRGPWVWRKSDGGWRLTADPDGERLFHAYDINNNAACEPTIGLGATVEEPNEGARFCNACVSVVKSLPEGRAPRASE